MAIRVQIEVLAQDSPYIECFLILANPKFALTKG